MKKIAIFFRGKKTPNIFRRVILKAFEEAFDKYTVCSAFFQHPYINKNNKTIGKFSTSNEILLALFKGRCYKKDINIYGLYESNNWLLQYNLTCNNLHNKLACCCNFKFFKFKNRKSHTKLFIAKDIKNIPRLAVIGSSNLSAGAFSDIGLSWNQECDVIFWDENYDISRRVMEYILDSKMFQENSLLFIADYNSKENNFSLENKLKLLEDQVLSSAEEYNIN